MATAKQLAALAKARAAKKKKATTVTKKRTVRKTPVTRKRNPIAVHDEYTVKIMTGDGREGFLYDWVKFDTVPAKGANFSRQAALIMAKALKALKLPNVKSVSVVKKK